MFLFVLYTLCKLLFGTDWLNVLESQLTYFCSLHSCHALDQLCNFRTRAVGINMHLKTWLLNTETESFPKYGFNKQHVDLTHSLFFLIACLSISPLTCQIISLTQKYLNYSSQQESTCGKIMMLRSCPTSKQLSFTTPQLVMRN